MAQDTNAFDRYDLATSGDTVRDDFTDLIEDISPTLTPFTANAGRAVATSTLHEWQIDSLADAVDNNFHIDGDAFSGDALTDPARIGNYCGIARKDIVVTRRASKVNTAGFTEALAYQIAKAGKELKRDVEKAIMANNAAVAGNSTTAPEFAGMGAWLTTNTSRGATGADGALSNTTYGVPTTAATDGTVRALTEDGVLGLIEDCYTEGGEPDTFMMSPTVKQLWSQYMFSSSARIATQYQDSGANPSGGLTVVGAVDVYVSDFGRISAVPNRFMRDRDFYILQMDMFELAYLDGYMVETIAKDSDADKRMLVVDLTLVCKNEAASAIYADVDATAAVTAS